jgi:S1-C subfamily serine protease
MEDIQLLEAIERYLSGAMLPDEKEYFEQLRKSTPEVDQMVVEHKLFLHQMEDFSHYRDLKNALHDSHHNLVNKGDIHEGEDLPSKSKLVQLWDKYRRVTAIAASIAGITTILISGLIIYFSPANKSAIEQLNRKVSNLEKTTLALNTEIKSQKRVNIPPSEFKSAGTGFLIDGKGYIVTSAHVLTATAAIVVNNKGNEYNARIINIDPIRDLALLKIDDSSFHPYTSVPYTIRKTGAELGEELFTLGYPRDSIVYNMGYLSAESGFDGDTSSYQISLSANPGNSGGPVFNRNGEIVGILSAREPRAQGVVFAIKAKTLLNLVNELKASDTSVEKLRIPSNNALKGLNRVDQVREVKDCVFLVKAYNQN